MQQRMVVGFMFDVAFQQVVLIRKTKPDWKAGRLNGIGGKVERGENSREAMAREFQEEAGLTGLTWQMYARLEDLASTWHLSVFWAVGDVSAVRTMEAEPVLIVAVDDVVKYTTLGNVPWLVAMAKAVGSGAESCTLFNVIEAEARK